MAFNQDFQINAGSFVPTTNVWDVTQIAEIENIDDNLRELLVRLYQNLNLMSEVLNNKVSGYYITDQFMTSKVYFNPTTLDIADLRPGFRITLNTGALAAGVKNVNLGFTWVAGWQFFFINGAATDSGTVTSVPLPFAGATGNNIEVIVNASTITITNNSGFTFDSSSIILEFVKP